MQSKRQIRMLLDSAGVRPDKRFGQHFLIDLNLMRLLIETAGIQKNDVVLEVGCGTGSLTQAIAEKAGFCVAVEIDAVLADIARNQLADSPNIEIIAADALKNKFEINPAVIDALGRAVVRVSGPRLRGQSTGRLTADGRATGRLLLVSNLPFSAATPVMLNLIAPASCCRLPPRLSTRVEAAGKTAAGVDAMFVTVQKEVADRMLAKEGTKDYGILSILLAATGDVKHVRTLKPTVFWPQPQVDSALVSYVRDCEKVKQIKSIEMLSKITAAFLQHRRKMLKSCCKLLTGGLSEISNWPEIFSQCDIDPETRPDHLTPEQFVCLANECA